jgi:hypothetical protein
MCGCLAAVEVPLEGEHTHRDVNGASQPSKKVGSSYGSDTPCLHPIWYARGFQSGDESRYLPSPPVNNYTLLHLLYSSSPLVHSVDVAMIFPGYMGGHASDDGPRWHCAHCWVHSQHVKSYWDIEVRISVAACSRYATVLQHYVVCKHDRSALSVHLLLYIAL